MYRREYLGGLAGLPAVGFDFDGRAQATESYHPGPPRFIHAGQAIMDPLGRQGNDRDALAPRVPNPSRNPDNYGAGAFQWSILDRPDGSSAELTYDLTRGRGEEYNEGTNNVAEFDPDVSGTYRLKLEAPDGTHELTVRVFPEPSGSGGPPQCRLDGRFDAGASEFVVTAEASAAPNSDQSDEDVTAEFHPDDRSSLARSDLDVSDTTARVPLSAVDGPTRIHGVAVGDRHSISDVVVLDPEAKTVSTPNRPPEWIKNATVYEIFTRSFGSGPGDVDFQYLESKVPYLEELGVDAVWLTPILEAYTHRHPNEPGGPHGYDTENYFDTASALGSITQFKSFVDACHDSDIKVIFDLVANHTSETHPFVEEASVEWKPYFDWFKRSGDRRIEGYYGWNLKNLNYENVAVREHMLAAVDFWSDIVDGFRCDVAWGVQHSFWKDVRALVKAKDPEFLLLDETLPYDPDFDASEFDMHFDTELNGKLASIANGSPPERVFDAINRRANSGFPEHTAMLQYIENHDMVRYLDRTDLSTQRAAAAATFTVPGVPMVYYGQERALTNYSDKRLGERGHFRAFMNWDNYDEAHLAFYKQLIEARSSIPALDHDAEMTEVTVDHGDVIGFERDARSLSVDGSPQQAVVLINFGSGTAEVDVADAVGTVDQFSGEDVATGDGTVAVETLAVLPGESEETGGGTDETVLSLSDPAGDDHGPGGYTYPTADVFEPGNFDVRGLTVTDRGDTWQFEVPIEGPLPNPWGYDGGFSLQTLRLYVRDEDTEGPSATVTDDGTNVRFEDAYHYRLQIDGRGASVTDAPGSVVTDGLSPAAENGAISVTVPKTALGGDSFEGKSFALLSLSHDGTTESTIRPVVAEASQWRLGGGGPDAPNVVDMLAPDGLDQGQALAHSEGQRATVPLMAGDGSVPDTGPGRLPDASGPPQDLDGDGTFEDVNGDGQTDLFDALDYYNNGDSPTVQNNVDAFDFDGDGDAGDLFDALELFNQIN